MYQNLEQRMAHTYVDMLPPFIPCIGAVGSVQSQQELYEFLKNMYQTLYQQPELLFKTFYEDDAYPNRYNRTSYGKPSLYNHMKSDQKKLEAWVSFLYDIGSKAESVDDKSFQVIGITISKANKELLGKFGFKLTEHTLSHPEYPGMFTAWRWMSTREGADVTAFSRAMFDQNHKYMEDIYAGLFGDNAVYAKLKDYLVKNGYDGYELVRGNFTLDYSREHATQPTPIGNPLYGDPNHTGVSFDYRPDIHVPQYMVLRILKMKDILLRYEEMSDRLKEFVWKYCKHCDNCNYCTQTDKTGKRLSAAIELSSPWGSSRLCPLYPGFSFTFEKLDLELCENIIEFLEFMDKS